MSSQETPRYQMIKQLQLLLGDQIVDVELDEAHYNLAVTMAVEKVRQRSQGSLEESHLYMTLIPDEDKYVLPDEVQEVVRIYRRGVGVTTAGGTNFQTKFNT